MTTVKASELEGTDFEGITISSADFDDAPDTGNSIPAGEVEEIARAEIGETGVFSSYDLVRLGDSLGPTTDSAKGKIYVDLRDTNDNAVDNRTEIRFVVRPQNGNRRVALTEFTPVRDLDRDDPRQRLALPPVSVEGKPAFAEDGRILAVEVRNPATSVTVSRSNSDMSIPARGGY